MQTSFKIKNFRKLNAIEYTFSNNLLITGKNAQGKTSIAEALYFCAFLYSPHTRKKEELIKFDEEYSIVEVTRESTIKFMLTKKNIKLSLDNLEITKPSEIVGKFNVVYLDPQTINLVEGSSGVRRKFINLQMSQENPEHMEMLNNYNKLLKQKRKLLKQNNVNQDYLTIVNQELEILNDIIITNRKIYLDALIKSAEKIVNWLTDSKEILSYKYTPIKITDQIVNKEIRYQSIMWGNHLDQIELFINDLNVRQFASQGQKRTLSIALNMAQMELLYLKKQEYPLVIIDDIFSELDSERQKKLYNLVSKKSQMILITPNVTNINPEILAMKNLQKITINNGEIL